MDKMVVNHLEKLFVTNDAATILNELEVRMYAFQLYNLYYCTRAMCTLKYFNACLHSGPTPSCKDDRHGN